MPLQETDNRIVKFNIDTGADRSGHDAVLQVEEEQLPAARVGDLLARRPKTVLKGGFGIFVGPGQTEDQIQPIEAERISTTLSSGPLLAYPGRPGADPRRTSSNNPNNRSYQPRAYADDYTLPEKVYQYTASVQQELGGSMAASAAYVGSQGRNLFLRSIANRTIGVQSNGACGGHAGPRVRHRHLRERDRAAPASLCPGSTIASVQKPYAEDRLQDQRRPRQLQRDAAGADPPVGRTASSLNAQYTLGYSKGTTGGSNEAATAGNNARALADFGLRQRLQQLRRPPHLQPEPALHDPGRRARSRADGRSAASPTRAAACRSRC